MKNRGGQGRVGLSVSEHVDKIFRCAASSRSDHGNLSRFHNRSGQQAIKASLQAISIHGGKQDFTRPKRFADLCPFDSLQPLFISAAACVNTPFFLFCLTRVDSEHCCLRTELFTEFSN